jgi:osmotically-inducible protein OsmY
MTRHPWLRLSLSVLAVLTLAGSLALAGCKKREVPPAETAQPTPEATTPAATPSATTDVAPTAGTTGVTAADADLNQKVKDAFAADATLAPITTIEVDAQNGVITLWGTAPTEAAKTAAGNAAKGVAGVKEVKNSITVAAK